MSVTIDLERESWADTCTLGEVLDRLKLRGRWVTQLTLDGQAADLDRLAQLRLQPAGIATVYIETISAHELVGDALAALESHISSADASRHATMLNLDHNQLQPALRSLSQCVDHWTQLDTALLQIARVLGTGDAFAAAATQASRFAAQLAEIRECLSNKDYVALADVLRYELAADTQQWRDAVAAMASLTRRLAA